MIEEIFDSILITLEDILSLKELPNFGVLDPTTTTNSRVRGGMSAIRAASKVLEFKKAKGLPTGPLPDGSPNIDDELWYIAIQAIMHEIVNESKISTSVYPGTLLSAEGFDAAGVPVAVIGFTTTFGIGGTVIE
jgi:hypothetical protein